MSNKGSHLAVLAEPTFSLDKLLEMSNGIKLHKAEYPMTFDEVKLYYFAIGPDWRMPTPVDIGEIPELDLYYNIWVDGDIVQEALKYTRPHLKRTLILIKR